MNDTSLKVTIRAPGSGSITLPSAADLSKMKVIKQVAMASSTASQTVFTVDVTAKLPFTADVQLDGASGSAVVVKIALQYIHHPRSRPGGGSWASRSAYVDSANGLADRIINDDCPTVAADTRGVFNISAHDGRVAGTQNTRGTIDDHLQLAVDDVPHLLLWVSMNVHLGAGRTCSTQRSCGQSERSVPATPAAVPSPVADWFG